MQIEHVQKFQKESVEISDMSSLILILMQALESNDMESLKFIIQQENLEIINQTLTNFTNETYYAKLVSFLTTELLNSPKETTNILKWLDIFLKKKAVFIQNNPDIIIELKKAKSVFVTKEKLYPNLLRLKGKIAFLIESKKLNHNPDKYIFQGFGVPKIIVDERENLGDDKDEDYKKGTLVTENIEEDDFEEDEIEMEEEEELANEEELLYEEEYENEAGAYEDNEEGSEVELGLELEEEMEKEDKKEKYLKLKNKGKKETQKR